MGIIRLQPEQARKILRRERQGPTEMNHDISRALISLPTPTEQKYQTRNFEQEKLSPDKGTPIRSPYQPQAS
jgi:hypothetical protein